ncbi:uncharacterized protein [Antedon mediterranea]|uniref:uncharacterized protein n=1 Tax=Antedon mediterranea TaxID=105859 RepID=UPI003AF88C8B
MATSNNPKIAKKPEMKCICENKEQVENYCQECEHYLCHSCSKPHKLLPTTKKHTLLSADEVQTMTPQQFALLKPAICFTHDKPLEMYCTTCKVPICINCTVTRHKATEDHDTIDVATAFNTFKETAKELQRAADKYTKKLNYGIQSGNRIAEKLKESKETSLRGIRHQVQEMINIIKKNGDKMEKKVQAIYENYTAVNDGHMKKLREIKSELKENEEFLDELVKGEPATAMTLSESALKTLKDQINNSIETKPKDNGSISFFGNRNQIDLLKQHNIGNVTQVIDYLTVTAPEAVTQGQPIVMKISKPQTCISPKLKATWTPPSGKTNNALVEDDNNDNYVIRGVCTTEGICTLNVHINDAPINQSPINIKVEKEGLVNEIRLDVKTYGLLKCDDGDLLVSCFTNEIYKYLQSEKYVNKIILPKDVEVNRMYKMKNYKIVFSDTGNKCIQVCDMNGKMIKSIGKGKLTEPYGIHIDEKTNVVYVADFTTGCCILTFDINSGEELIKIGQQKGGQFKYSDVTLTKTGEVLLVDRENHQVLLYDKDNKSLKVLIDKGLEDGKVHTPWAVVVDDDDNIIIASDNKVQLFSSDGQFIKIISGDNSHQLCVISSHPRRIAIPYWIYNTIKIFNY